MRIIQQYLIGLFLFVSISLSAQDVFNTAPASLKWRQINTPNFKVIFPKGFDSEAQKVANTLQYIHQPASSSIGKKSPRKISIVIQNQNSISNGFVTLGPRRSEFFSMPPQDYNFIGTNQWLPLLAIHEYRHIAQFQQSKVGFNKLISIVFGQFTQAGMAQSAAPPWFFEGDATVIESTFTKSGRGRIPAHDLVFRSNLLGGKRFNYHKQHLLSFKDFIPDHYRLGYYYIGHVRKRTKDRDIWKKVTHSAWSWPFVPFTFSNSLKKHTGYNIVQNYEMMMDEMEGKWKKQLEGLELTE